MNEFDSKKGSEPEEDVVGRLLQLAGERPEPRGEVRAEIERAIHDAWRAKVRAHAEASRRPRWAPWVLAAAAVLVLAVALSFVGPGSPAQVATVEGMVRSADLLRGESSTALEVGAAVAAGSTVETADSRVALRLANGVSARLDGRTRLTLHSPEVLELTSGAVYLDSGDSQAALEVRTSYGVARDIGTQFEVRLAEGDSGARSDTPVLEVRVREGKVELEHADTLHEATAGTALTVAADGGVERSAVASHAPAWDWVLELTPPFELEGQSVAGLLAWTARETGLEVRWADPALEIEAAETTAHGSIEGLGPIEALEVVLPSSGLDFRREDGAIVVERFFSKDSSDSRH